MADEHNKKADTNNLVDLDGIDRDDINGHVMNVDGLTDTVSQSSLNSAADLPQSTSNVNDTSDLPKSLIVTNVNLQVFENDAAKETFENVFREYESGVTFNYLKNFRRARVNFDSTDAVVQARLNLHEKDLLGGVIKCYFVQVANSSDEEDSHLHPPLPDKMFLISPPASPPVDWEPIDESHPIIDHSLVEALANLKPGSTHELHPASDEQPGIVVHVCEDPEGYREKPKLKYIQTRRPGKKSS